MRSCGPMSSVFCLYLLRSVDPLADCSLEVDEPAHPRPQQVHGELGGLAGDGRMRHVENGANIPRIVLLNQMIKPDGAADIVSRMVLDADGHPRFVDDGNEVIPQTSVGRDCLSVAELA